MISNQALAVAQKYLAGVQPNDMLQKLPSALEAMGAMGNKVSLVELMAAHKALQSQEEDAKRQQAIAMAQGGGGQPGQQNSAQPTTVADDLKNQLGQAQQAAQMDTGIGGLPDNFGEEAFAGGGIVAFDGKQGSEVKAPKYSLTDEQKAYLAETDKIVGLPAGTSYRQIEVESAFNPRAVSPAKAMGLAQIIPITLPGASRLVGRKIDPFNPTDALEAHRALMKENMARFKDPVKALRAYNGGWTESTWDETDENRNYAPKILGFLTASGNANAAETPRAAAPVRTSVASIPQSDTVEGNPLAAAGIAAGAAAAGVPSVLNRVNESRRAADIAKLAGGQPIPPGSVVPSSAMRPPVTVGSLVKKAVPTNMGIKSGLGAATIGAVGYDVASNLWNTPTDEYYRRSGLNMPNYSSDDSALTQVGQEAKTLGVRGLGALEEGINTLTGGYWGKFRGFRRPTTPTATKPADEKPVDATKPSAPSGATPVAETNTTPPNDSIIDRVGEELFTRIKGEKLPETEEQYNARHDKIAKDLGVDPASTKKFFEAQVGKLTEQAVQARQDRNVDLWMSAAQGFFAMAGGTSPHAMKNFADGLGVGTKQMTAALHEYKGIERDITKNQREIEKLQISANMGHAEKKSERMDKYLGRQEALEVRKTANLQNLYSTLTQRETNKINQEANREETKRRNKVTEDDRRAGILLKAEKMWDEKIAVDPELRKLANEKDPAKQAAAKAALMFKKRTFISGMVPSQGSNSPQSGGAGERPSLDSFYK